MISPSSVLCWDSTHCAFSIILPPSQTSLYQVPLSLPHICLSKTPTDRWRNLGPLLSCVNHVLSCTHYSPPPFLHTEHPTLTKAALHSLYVIIDTSSAPVHTFFLSVPTPAPLHSRIPSSCSHTPPSWISVLTLFFIGPK